MKAGEELNDLVAEKVLGRKRCVVHGGFSCVLHSHYSTGMVSTMAVDAEMWKRDIHVRRAYRKALCDLISARMDDWDLLRCIPEMVCLAALKAVEHDNPSSPL